MSPNPEARKITSFRIRAELLAQVNTFVRDNAGAPLYLNKAVFFEAAALAYIKSLEANSDFNRLHDQRNHINK